MNKNVIIGILVTVVVIGLGAFIMNNNKVVTPVNDTSSNVTPTQQVANQNTPTLNPDAPIVITSKDNLTSNSTASLSGSVKPNGASTTYWFEYGVSTSFGNQSISQAIGSGYSSIPATGFISGLKANTLYYYRLSAKNRFSTVNGAMYTLQTNGNPPPKVVATTVHTTGATSISRMAAILNGEVNPNGTATNYWYEYGTDTSFGYVTLYQGTNSGSSFMSVPTSISELKPLTKYYFRLNAQNQFGTVNGSVLSFTTTGPVDSSKPTVVTSNAKSVSSTDAVFVGSINPNGAETTYWFEYSTDSLLASLIGSGTPKGTLTGTKSEVVQINVNGLQANTTYYYHLVGQNQNGIVNGSTVRFTTRK